MPLSKFANIERNLGILQRHVRGERTLREEASAQGVRYQRIDQIIKSTTKQLLKDLERDDVARQDVLDYYRIDEEQLLMLILEYKKKEL